MGGLSHPVDTDGDDLSSLSVCESRSRRLCDKRQALRGACLPCVLMVLCLGGTLMRFCNDFDIALEVILAPDSQW